MLPQQIFPLQDFSQSYRHIYSLVYKMVALCFHAGIHGHECKGSAHDFAAGLCFQVVHLRTLLTHKDRWALIFCLSRLNYDHAV